MVRTPCLFVNHGGGPMPLFGADDATAADLRRIAARVALPSQPTPTAMLVISAHWEASPLRVTSSPAPTMLYDYSGFPPETYAYRYAAPGSPSLAARVVSILNDAGHACVGDDDRGFDHGVFVPLMIAFPEATIPIVVLSLAIGMDAAKHLAMGRALAPLRDEGVCILGSGSSFHNMPAMMSRMGRHGGSTGDDPPPGKPFDDALVAACTANNSALERASALASWNSFPGARDAHPPRRTEVSE